MTKKSQTNDATWGISSKPITAEDMAKAIERITQKLEMENIIVDRGSLSKETGKLKKQGAATSWDFEIGRENPIRFLPCEDKSGNPVYPRLVCAGISVKQESHDHPPFTALDIAIEIDDAHRHTIAKWHIDLANEKEERTRGRVEKKMQNGPLIHLQYGGHIPNQRSSDHPLKEPRWCHPPMDMILLCEVIAANFYPNIWEEKLREDHGWRDAISIAQKLCYSAYLRKFISGMSISSKTLLHSMWASEWNSSAQ